MSPQIQPVLFIGHGSPMNAIEDNIYTRKWQKMGQTFAKPRAILMISAHYITEGKTQISTAEYPDMIYDMHGFPDTLYQVRYPASGSAGIAKEIIQALFPYNIQEDPKRGFDHGSWSVLLHLFPNHDIPVISLSIDYDNPPEWHYDLGKKLSVLRDQGILIIASGNTVHNLGKVSFISPVVYPWAQEFDERVVNGIVENNHIDIVRFLSWGSIARLAHPTHDHFLPLLVALGATHENDCVETFTRGIDLGSISMTSFIWHKNNF